MTSPPAAHRHRHRRGLLRYACRPLNVAKPDPVVERHPSETDPLWFKKRPAKFDWWRSSWNPVDWDAEEWFASGKQHAPWVEHTLALIEEGWDNLTYETPPPLQPERVVRPPPQPLSLFEIWCKQRVQARREKEAAASAAMWAEIGTVEAKHHDVYRRDVRIKDRQSDFPNFKPRDAWTEEEIEALIACPPGVEAALTVLDPRWRADYSGMRKPDVHELEFLKQTGRLVEYGTMQRNVGGKARRRGAGTGAQEGEAAVGEELPMLGEDDFDSTSAEELSDAVDIGGDDDTDF